jgi:hypothetical protein
LPRHQSRRRSPDRFVLEVTHTRVTYRVLALDDDETRGVLLRHGPRRGGNPLAHWLAVRELGNDGADDRSCVDQRTSLRKVA